MNAAEYDVAIIGYGPVGRLLALKLGRRGHTVAVVERQLTNYFLPRAVHLDDEVCRILQSVGLRPDTIPDAVSPYDDFYEWRNSEGEVLLRLDWRGRGPSGWNVSNFFHQPEVERALDAMVRDSPSVTIFNGHRALALHESDDRVDVNLEGPERRHITARYVVGADGANSMVREWIGGTTTDLGYFHDWVVVDLIMKTKEIVFDPPASQLCDPKRPTTLVPGGPGRRRFEFMRLPGESREHLAEEKTAWALLAPWGIGPEDADLERNTVYTFQARWSNDWRKGRLILAGDSAHLMPPFAGQGMCSGLRDVMNLEWKLDRVLRGAAPPHLLDSYGPERSEHVRHFIEESMELGEVICITDPDAARARDIELRAEHAAVGEKPARPLPRLGAGVHRDDEAGGLLSIQGMVTGEDGPALFDDVVGHGPVLISDTASLLDELNPSLVGALEDDGVRFVSFGPHPGPRQIVDVEGDYAQWFTHLGARAVLVRPDFYIYGAASTSDDLTALLEAYRSEWTVDVGA